MPDPQLRHHPAGEAEIVETGKELDIYTAPAFRNLVFGLIDRGRSNLVISLEQTEFVDSTGLGVLVGALRRVRARDGWLSVVCARETTLRMFRIAGLLPLLDVHDTIGAALAARGVAKEPGESQ